VTVGVKKRKPGFKTRRQTGPKKKHWPITERVVWGPLGGKKGNGGKRGKPKQFQPKIVGVVNPTPKRFWQPKKSVLQTPKKQKQRGESCPGGKNEQPNQVMNMGGGGKNQPGLF